MQSSPFSCFFPQPPAHRFLGHGFCRGNYAQEFYTHRLSVPTFSARQRQCFFSDAGGTCLSRTNRKGVKIVIDLTLLDDEVPNATDKGAVVIDLTLAEEAAFGAKKKAPDVRLHSATNGFTPMIVDLTVDEEDTEEEEVKTTPNAPKKEPPKAEESCAFDGNFLSVEEISRWPLFLPTEDEQLCENYDPNDWSFESIEKDMMM